MNKKAKTALLAIVILPLVSCNKSSVSLSGNEAVNTTKTSSTYNSSTKTSVNTASTLSSEDISDQKVLYGIWYKTGDSNYRMEFHKHNESCLYFDNYNESLNLNVDSEWYDGKSHTYSDSDNSDKITLQYQDNFLKVTGSDNFDGNYYKNDSGNNDFLQPYSSEIFLYEDDYYGYSLDELKTARNEILARHGYYFIDDTDAQSNFNNKKWYGSNDSLYPGFLNYVEASNLAVLNRLIEEKHTWKELPDSPSKEELSFINSGLQTINLGWEKNNLGLSLINNTFEEHDGYNTVDAVLYNSVGATEEEVQKGLLNGQITLVTDAITGKTEDYKIYTSDNKNDYNEYYDIDSDKEGDGTLIPLDDGTYVEEVGSDDRVYKDIKKMTVYLSPKCRIGVAYGFSFGQWLSTPQIYSGDDNNFGNSYNVIEMNKLGYITGMYKFGGGG